MLILCNKNCGVAINVTDEMLDDAKKLGLPLNVAHETCPRDAKHFPQYRMTIYVMRHDWDSEEEGYVQEGLLLTTVGGTVQAPSFADAFDGITKELSDQIESVSKMRHVIEDGLTTPQDH